MQALSLLPSRSRKATLFLSSGVILAILGGIVAFVAAGCHRTPSPDVVATVNGKEIKRAELERQYQSYRSNLGNSPQEPSPEQANLLKLMILRSMIEDEIIQQQAAKFNLSASDEDVNAKLTEMKAPYTQEEFDRLLQQRNQTADDLKRDIRRSLTQNKLMNKQIESKINITDAEISAYYNAHKAELNFIEPQYHLAEIVVRSSGAPPSGNLQNNKVPTEADAKKRIQTIQNQLDSGSDFGAVAVNESEDATSASNGGDMGFIPESALHSDIDAYNAINKLKPGQYSPILSVIDGQSHKTIGYAIYKLIERQPAGQRDLSDPRIQQAIRQQLRESHTQLLKNAYLEVLHNEAVVHNYFAEQIVKEGAK